MQRHSTKEREADVHANIFDVKFKFKEVDTEDGYEVSCLIRELEALAPLHEKGKGRFTASRISNAEAAQVCAETTAEQRPPPPLVPKGWAIRPPVERSNFTPEQRALLTEIYDRPERLTE